MNDLHLSCAIWKIIPYEKSRIKNSYIQGWKPEDLKVYVTWEFTIQDKTAKGQTKSYKKGINPDIFEQFRVDIGDRFVFYL